LVGGRKTHKRKGGAKELGRGTSPGGFQKDHQSRTLVSEKKRHHNKEKTKKKEGPAKGWGCLKRQGEKGKIALGIKKPKC